MNNLKMTDSRPPVKKGFIFDCDGLLLDTEEICFYIGKQILSRYGKEFTWKVKESLMGLPANENVDLLISSFDLPITREEYIKDTELFQVLILNLILVEAVSALKSPSRGGKTHFLFA